MYLFYLYKILNYYKYLTEEKKFRMSLLLFNFALFDIKQEEIQITLNLLHLNNEPFEIYFIWI